MQQLRKSQSSALVIGLSVGAMACSGRGPAAPRSLSPPILNSPQLERGESMQRIEPALGSPGPDTPLFEVHASLAPAEHRHFDGKIARLERLAPVRAWQRFRISIDGSVTRDAPVGGAVDDMPLQSVADKTFELWLPAGVAVALAVGQRLQGSMMAGADAQPATMRALLQDDLGPVLALREVPDGFVVQAEPVTVQSAPGQGPRRVALSATWPGIKTQASLEGWSAWGIAGQPYLLFGYGDVAIGPAPVGSQTTVVFALLRQAAQ